MLKRYNDLFASINEKELDALMDQHIAESASSDIRHKVHHLIFKQLAHYKRFDLIKNLCKRDCYKSSSVALFAAVEEGYLDIIKYLFKKGHSIPFYLELPAIGYEQINCLNYFVELGYASDPQVCEYYAKKGDLEHLKLAHKNGCEWDGRTLYAAKINGHMDCYSYAEKHNCPSYKQYLEDLGFDLAD